MSTKGRMLIPYFATSVDTSVNTGVFLMEDKRSFTFAWNWERKLRSGQRNSTLTEKTTTLRKPGKPQDQDS